MRMMLSILYVPVSLRPVYSQLHPKQAWNTIVL